MKKVIQFLDALKKELPNMFEIKEGAPMPEFWESFYAAYQEAVEHSVQADLGWTCECEAVNWQKLEFCGICGKPRPSR